MATNLSDAQKQQLIAWINEGAKLSEIQKRLETEFGLRLTYMDVKMLVGDLQVTPKDPEVPVVPPAPAPAAPAPGGPAVPDAMSPLPAGGGSVSVSVDKIARPGSMVSGNVTFSDGKSAVWYLDQMGRLGLAPQEKGYRPNPQDMQNFQAALEQELARQGF